MSFLERFKGKTSVMDKSGVQGIVTSQGQSIDKDRVLANMSTEDSLSSMTKQFKKKNNLNERYFETTPLSKFDGQQGSGGNGQGQYAQQYYGGNQNKNNFETMSVGQSYNMGTGGGLPKYQSFQQLGNARYLNENNDYSSHQQQQNPNLQFFNQDLSHTVNLSNSKGNNASKHFYQRKDSANSVNSAFSRLQNYDYEQKEFYTKRQYGGGEYQNKYNQNNNQFQMDYYNNGNYNSYGNGQQAYQYQKNNYPESNSPTLIRQSQNILNVTPSITSSNNNQNTFSKKNSNQDLMSNEFNNNFSNIINQPKKSNNLLNNANYLLQSQNNKKEFSDQNAQNQLQSKHQVIIEKIAKIKKQQY